MKTTLSEHYGKVEGKRAQLIYSSITGNTEKIAKAFERVLREYGFEVDVVKAEDDEHGYVGFDYDLYVMGGGVIGGLPERNLIAAVGNGAFGNVHLKSNKGLGFGCQPGTPTFGRGVKLKKAVSFLTYEGSRRGPAEVAGPMSMLEIIMTDGGWNCIGEFACPGLKSQPDRSFNMYQQLAEELGKTYTEAVPILEGYLRNEEYAASLSDEVRAACKRAAEAFQSEDERRKGTPAPWHNTAIDRPCDRDIAMAEIFMAELIEDVFLPYEKENITSVARCIY